MEKKAVMISPVFVDFGAKNTGVVLLHGSPTEKLKDWDRRAILITAGNGKTYAQTQRRAKRHQKRNIERRQMAKRLLRLILRDVYKIKSTDLVRSVGPNQSFEQFAAGLLNRRGFTFAGDESENDDYQLMPFCDFREIISSVGLKCEGSSFSEHLGRLSAQGASDLSEILKNPIFDGLAHGGKFPESIQVDNEERKKFKRVLKAYQETIFQYIRAEVDGHKPRSIYLAEIDNHISSNAEFIKILNIYNVNKKSFIFLIGNISNLQLRVLRKYFNEKEFRTGDQWIPAKLDNLLKRYVRSFHPSTDQENTRQKEFFKALQNSSGNLVSFLESTDPSSTIPPLEDQNNRRPQKCQSLLLDESQLSAKFPSWRDWARRIRNQHGDLVLEGDDHGKRINSDARVLQRFLEQSKEKDGYGLRKLVSNGKIKETEGHQKLKQLLGVGQAEEFVSFSNLFFSETRQARRSIWAEQNPERLLRICNLTTPARKNVRDIDLARLLRAPRKGGLTSDMIKVFKENPTVSGRTKLKGVLERISDIQREYQQELKIVWELNAAGAPKPDAVDDKDWAALSAIRAVSDLLSKQVGASAPSICNPWSLSALWQIMADRDGHSSTCRCCAEDNFWRVMPSGVERGVANGVALPADSVRPFDGLIAKLVQDQAEVIASEKICQLEEVDAERATVDIVLEENVFSSSEEILLFKKDQGFSKSKRENDRILSGAARFNQSVATRLGTRLERLREFSGGVCPYLGSALGESGEIDHILPRSLTLQWFGAVLNHEANLMYVSQRGNQAKKNAIYDLSNCHVAFKNRFFPNMSDDAIEEAVEEVISRLFDNNKIELQFALLDRSEQAAIRFGLFIERFRKRLTAVLIQSNRVRVNGTQRYLAKEIRNRIIAKSKNKFAIEVDIRFADPTETSDIRSWLAKQEGRLAKPAKQPVQSHIIDATIGGLSMIGDRADQITSEALLNGKHFLSILPQQIDIKDLVSRPRVERYDTFASEVFKASMYGERFVPVWLTANGVGLGFSESDLLMVPERNQEAGWAKLSRFLIGKGGTKASSNLADAKSKVLETGKYFTVNQKEFFIATKTLALNPSNDQALFESCAAISKLRYFVKKADFFKTSWPDKKLEPIEAESLRKDLLIKMNFEGAKGDLMLPAMNEWIRAINELKHANLPREKGEKLTEEFLKLGHKIFNVPEKSRRQAVRKVFSLPLLDSPSGGFRIRRLTPSSEHAYQVQSAHAQARGRLVDNPKKFLALPGLISESVTPVELGDLFNSGRFISFTRWFDLPISQSDKNRGIISGKFQLATKDRADIELEITYNLLAQILGEEESCGPESVGPMISDFSSPLGDRILGKARDGKVEVVAVKERSVVVRYVRDSGSAELVKLAAEIHRSPHTEANT